MINEDLINTLKGNFSGSSDYLSGVNDGLYAMLNTIKQKQVTGETPIQEEIRLAVQYIDMDKVVLTNKSGDTYTSKSEELMDFLHGQEHKPDSEENLHLKELSEITNDEHIQVAKLNKEVDGETEEDAPRTDKGLLTYGIGITICQGWGWKAYQYLQSRNYKLPKYY